MKRPPPTPCSTPESVPMPSKKPYDITKEPHYSSSVPVDQKLKITRLDLQDACNRIKVEKRVFRDRSNPLVCITIKKCRRDTGFQEEVSLT